MSSTIRKITAQLANDADRLKQKSISAKQVETLAAAVNRDGKVSSYERRELLELFHDGFQFSAEATSVLQQKTGLSASSIARALGSETSSLGGGSTVTSLVPQHKMRAGESFSGVSPGGGGYRPSNVTVSYDGKQYWATEQGYRSRLNDGYTAWALWNLLGRPEDKR